MFGTIDEFDWISGRGWIQPDDTTQRRAFFHHNVIKPNKLTYGGTVGLQVGSKVNYTTFQTRPWQASYVEVTELPLNAPVLEPIKRGVGDYLFDVLLLIGWGIYEAGESLRSLVRKK